MRRRWTTAAVAVALIGTIAVLARPRALATIEAVGPYIRDVVEGRAGPGLSAAHRNEPIPAALAAPEPTEAETQRYYQTRQARYTVPGTVSFSHVYFASPDAGGPAARARAQAVLADLSDAVVRAPMRGDGFPDAHDYQGVDPCSSARWFTGWRIPISGDHGRAPVSPARTWLLATGWQRAGGPLHRSEGPARKKT